MRPKSSFALTLTLFLLFLLCTWPLPHNSPTTGSPTTPGLAASSATISSALAAYGHLPLSFEANQGQTDPSVRFVTHGPGYSLFLSPTVVLLALSKQHQPSSALAHSSPAASFSSPSSADQAAVVAMQFSGANAQPELSGEEVLPGTVNYLIGNDPSMWHTNIPIYAKVHYHNLYPGVDLVYYGNQAQLEYDFVVAPGADPRQIRLNFSGTTGLSLDAQGGLLLHLASGTVQQGIPHVYQEVAGARQVVSSHYVLQGASQVGFALGAYDASQPLVIDPTIVYSTYLGGSVADFATGITVDSAGSAYVTGWTSSLDFPVVNALQPTYGGSSQDSFVAKINPSGTVLVYSTYLGGNSNDGPGGIGVDSAGDAYLSGWTASRNFPIKNALMPVFTGSADGYLTKLTPTGNDLLFSTFLGGNGQNIPTGLAVDSTGNAYVTGWTNSTDFPLVTPVQTCGTSVDPFLLKMNPSGSALLYSTCFGGSDEDFSLAIGIDSSGDAYITGYTFSPDFPLKNALFPTFPSNTSPSDGFVAKFTAAGNALVYSTFLGGSLGGSGSAIAADSAGNAYVVGGTYTPDFPTKNAIQPTYAGSGDAYITKINPTGSALVYSTFLGGSNQDVGSGVAVDSAGNAYITGLVISQDFPTKNAIQPTSGGGMADAFVTAINAAGSDFLYSTYLGGASLDEGQAIAVDGSGSAYVAGFTSSTDFPIVGNAFQPTNHGNNTFITRIYPTNIAIPLLNQTAVAVTTTPGASPSSVPLTLSNAGTAALNWSSSGLQPWVSLSPSSGSVPPGGSQVVMLNFNTPSPTSQAYTTTLTLSDPNAFNSPISLPVTVVSAAVSKTWYFAEGYTGIPFSEFLTLANPNSVQANVTVTYLLGSGSPIIRHYPVSGNQRFTVRVNDEVGINRNVSMVVSSDQPIVAERPMYFTYAGLPGFSIPGGSDVLGATQLGTSFDFGYLDTSVGHDTWLTILNQNSTPLTASIHYFPDTGGAGTTIQHTFAANSRGTVHVNTEGLAAGSYSALVTLSQPGLVERPLYLQDTQTLQTGAADVVGVAMPQQNWYFAEGFTGPTFEERYILSNPNTSGQAHVTVTFFRSDKTTATAQVTLSPGEQQVVDANAVLGGGNVSNSAKVTSDLPILAERFMSFFYNGVVGNGSTGAIPGATDVLGASAPTNLFYFAEGYTGSTFAEYLTIENPDPSNTATVQVMFLPTKAPAFTRVYQVAPGSRFTLFTNTVLNNQSFSMVVESNVPIVAERPMYFNFAGSVPGQTGGSDVIGYQP
ncbi:MAG TPA: SBBP repeat-containing protein [Ktedonobacterales bacterium]|jgi:hypothetical protein